MDGSNFDATRSIAVCIAAFNRRDTTLACLDSLVRADRPGGLEIEVYLLDDASTDGTAEAVRSRFPDVKLLRGTGALFWAGGMRIAYAAALEHPHPYFLWMNDDVIARFDALTRLVETERALRARDGWRHIVAGGMWDPDGDRASYGAYDLASRINPSRIRLVLPDDCEPRDVDLVNANMMLIPADIARSIGNIPKWYTHSMADWDYGLRARRAGFGVSLAPGYVGDCGGNIAWRRRWHAPEMTLYQRYRAMLGPLALPFVPRARFLLAHFPWLAPLYIFTPYLKLPFDHLFMKLRSHGA